MSTPATRICLSSRIPRVVSSSSKRSGSCPLDCPCRSLFGLSVLCSINLDAYSILLMTVHPVGMLLPYLVLFPLFVSFFRLYVLLLPHLPLPLGRISLFLVLYFSVLNLILLPLSASPCVSHSDSTAISLFHNPLLLRHLTCILHWSEETGVQPPPTSLPEVVGTPVLLSEHHFLVVARTILPTLI